MQPQSKRPGTRVWAGRGLDHGPAPASRQTPPVCPHSPHSRLASPSRGSTVLGGRLGRAGRNLALAPFVPSWILSHMNVLLARKIHEPNKDRIKLKKPLACSAGHAILGPGATPPAGPSLA